MKDTETKYKILIDRLREAKPDAGNPDMLTAEIMQAIGLQHQNSASRLIVWVRPLMTAAAVFLLGLFLYQQLELPETIQEATISKSVNLSLLNKTNCSYDSTSKHSENKQLFQKYMCYMRNSMAENEQSKQFYQKYLPKYR